MNIRRLVNFFTIYISPIVSSILACYFFIEMMDAYRDMNMTVTHSDELEPVVNFFSTTAQAAFIAAAGFGFVMFRTLFLIQAVALLWWLRLWYFKKFYTLPKFTSDHKSFTFEAKLYTTLSLFTYSLMLLFLFS